MKGEEQSAIKILPRTKTEIKRSIASAGVENDIVSWTLVELQGEIKITFKSPFSDSSA